MFVPSAASRQPPAGAVALPDRPRVWTLPRWGRMDNARRVAELGRIGREAGTTDPRLRRLAVRIFRAAGVQPRDYRGQAEAIHRFVRDHVYFVNEADEVLQDPAYTLDLQGDGFLGPAAAGDCDDFTTALIALYTAIHLPALAVTSGRLRDGRPVRYVEGTGRSPQAAYTHAYGTVGLHPYRPKYDPATWAWSDASVRTADLGWDVVGRGRSDPQLGDGGEERVSGIGWGTAISLVGVSVASALIVRQLDRLGWMG